LIRHILLKISPNPSFPKRGNSVRRQSPNARFEVSNAALDGGASLWKMVRHAHHPEPVEGGREEGFSLQRPYNYGLISNPPIPSFSKLSFTRT